MGKTGSDTEKKLWNRKILVSASKIWSKIEKYSLKLMEIPHRANLWKNDRGGKMLMWKNDLLPFYVDLDVLF